MVLNSWKARKLSLNGKVIIIKSLAISQIIYLLNLQPFPDDYIKELESIIYEFLWNGKTHKVKKSVMIQDYVHGGHKMIDIRTLNLVQKMKWIKLYLNGHDCLWRYLFEAFVNVNNLNILLRSNFVMINTLAKSSFYIEVLKSLHRLNNIDQSYSDENIKTQFIFYNRNININGKMLKFKFKRNLLKNCKATTGETNCFKIAPRTLFIK